MIRREFAQETWGEEQEEKAVNQGVVENIEEMEHCQSKIQIIHLALSVSFSRGS